MHYTHRALKPLWHFFTHCAKKIPLCLVWAPFSRYTRLFHCSFFPLQVEIWNHYHAILNIMPALFTNKLNDGMFNDITDQFCLLCLYSRGCRVCWPITSHGWCWRIWTRPEFEVCQVGSVMEPQNTGGFFSEIKKNAGEAAFGRVRRRFMDAVKEDIKFRWCERRGCRGFGGRLGDWLWPPCTTPCTTPRKKPSVGLG